MILWGSTKKWTKPDEPKATPEVRPMLKLDNIFKAEVDYHARAVAAWETRARGDGRTAQDARAFIHGKPVVDKVKAQQAEIDKLKAQLKAALADKLKARVEAAKPTEYAPAPAPKGKLQGLDTKQRKSLYTYFEGGGPREKGERAYYLARAKQVVDGVARPHGMSAKFGVDRMRVGKIEGQMYFIQKAWRQKNGV